MTVTDEKKNDQMKDQLLKLKTENFALAQRIKREQEKFTQVNEDKLRLMSNLEMGDERCFVWILPTIPFPPIRMNANSLIGVITPG